MSWWEQEDIEFFKVVKQLIRDLILVDLILLGIAVSKGAIVFLNLSNDPLTSVVILIEHYLIIIPLLDCGIEMSSRVIISLIDKMIIIKANWLRFTQHDLDLDIREKTQKT